MSNKPAASSYFGLKPQDLTPQQVEQLVAGGYMSPDLAQMLAPTPVPAQDLSSVAIGQVPVAAPAVTSTGSPTQDAIGAQMQAAPATATPDSNLTMAQEAPEAYNAMYGSMQGIPGMQTPELPGPLMSSPTTGPQASPEQMMAQEQEQTRAVASEKAAQVAEKSRIDEAQKKADLMAKADEAVETKVKADLEQDEKDGDMSWGQRIGQAVAIMVGAYSQGLTGNKENPAVVAIDKAAEQRAQQRKYNAEQTMKMKDVLLKQAQYELEKRKSTIDSMTSLRKLEQADEEIAIARAKLGLEMQSRHAAGQTRFSQAEAMALGGKDGAEIRERLVRLPDGTYAPALAAEDAKHLRKEVLPNIESSLRALTQLEKQTDYFGNNPLKKVLSRAQKGTADQAVQELVGAIRLEYFGPGILTDNEQEIARSMIGNPSKVWSLDSANRAKLQNMMEKLKFSRRTRLREAGVDLPMSRNEAILEQAQSKYPNTPKSELINALIRQGKWDRKEE
jgi:hypothetical protein